MGPLPPFRELLLVSIYSIMEIVLLFYVFEFCDDHVANKNVLSNLVKRKFIPCASGKYICGLRITTY